MRSPLDTSTLVPAGAAVVLVGIAYLKDPGVPPVRAKNSVAMLGFVIPRMVVAIVLVGLMQCWDRWCTWLVSVFNHE